MRIFSILLIWFLTTFALADAVGDEALESKSTLFGAYIKVCDAQKEVFEQLQCIEEWRMKQLESLRSQGYASWQESRRQAFVAESSLIKSKYYAEYVQFLNQIRGRMGDNPLDDTGLKAIRVFMPGSQRLIGWLNGFELQKTNFEKEMKAARDGWRAARQRIQKLDRILEQSQADESWNTKSRLNRQLAVSESKLHQSTLDYLSRVQKSLENRSDSNMQSTQQTVFPKQDQDLGYLVAKLARLEVDSDGHLQQVQRHLDRQKKRLAAIKELSHQGHASNFEIEELEKHVARLKQSREEISFNMNQLRQSLEGIVAMDLDPSINDSPPMNVGQWPDSAFLNASRIQYLVDQRWAQYEERTRLEVYRRKLHWLNEILVKLKAANDREVSDGDNRFGRMMTLAQSNEIENYRWKIDSLKHAIANSESRIQIIALEQQRFMAQIVVMDQLPQNTQSEPLVRLDQAKLLSSFLSTLEYSNAQPTSQVTFGYIESNVLDIVGGDVELVFSQHPGYPLSSFAPDDDLLQPVRLTDYTRSLNLTRRSSIQLAVGPAPSSRILGSGGIRKTSGYQSSNRDIAAPSLYNSPFATRDYRSNQYKSGRFYESAYPFGILRSDLRRFSRYSQSPWYLPGWPDNLKTNQLRSEYRRNFNSHSGYDLLKSRNYLNLEHPDFVD